MFAHERHQAIQQLLSKKRRLTVAALQRELKISSATLRRDLTELENENLVVRVHGGVVHPSALRSEPTFTQKGARSMAAKRAIARATADLIPDGATLFIDAGTTCLEVARLLLTRRDLKLITNSVPLLSLASTEHAATVIGLGGELRAVSGALTGSLALSWLESVHADIAIVAASGLSLEEGASTTELAEAAMKQQFLSRSTQRILVADSTKWNAPSTAKFAEWSGFNTWVTDAILTPRERTALTRHQLNLIQVKNEAQ